MKGCQISKKKRSSRLYFPCLLTPSERCVYGQKVPSKTDSEKNSRDANVDSVEKRKQMQMGIPTIGLIIELKAELRCVAEVKNRSPKVNSLGF